MIKEPKWTRDDWKFVSGAEAIEDPRVREMIKQLRWDNMDLTEKKNVLMWATAFEEFMVAKPLSPPRPGYEESEEHMLGVKELWRMFSMLAELPQEHVMAAMGKYSERKYYEDGKGWPYMFGIAKGIAREAGWKPTTTKSNERAEEAEPDGDIPF